MKLARRTWLRAGLTLPLLGRSAFAQSFPDNRPIRWVVPFPPGGQTDSTARLTAQGLATALPANIVVENRAGGQGTVGSDHVRQSPPDGHTLLFSASIFALGRHILKSTRPSASRSAIRSLSHRWARPAISRPSSSTGWPASTSAWCPIAAPPRR